MSTTLRLRAAARFLASIFDGLGTKVRKDGLATYIDLDFSQIQQLTSYDASVENVLVQNANDGSFARVPLGSVRGSGIGLPTGRLTLTSGTPYMATSVVASSVVYYTPIGGQIPIWDGVEFVMQPFSELSHTLSDATHSPAAASTNLNYDLYVWDNGGSLVLSRSSSWKFGGSGGSDTARGVGVGGAEIMFVSGITVNKQNIANGPAAGFGTYVGTIRTNGSSTVDFIYGATGTAAFFGVWNAYNRARVTSMSADSTAFWDTTSATIRQANASALNQASFVTGAAVDGIQFTYMSDVATTNVLGATVYVGAALDSKTVFDKRAFVTTPAAQVLSSGLVVPVAYPPQLGFHYISANEASDGTNDATWVGQNRQSLVFSMDM